MLSDGVLIFLVAVALTCSLWSLFVCSAGCHGLCHVFCHVVIGFDMVLVVEGHQ